MTRLIDADKAIEATWEQPTYTDPLNVLTEVRDRIRALPTVDAVPVKHGKWELAEGGWYCSACELYPPFDCDPEEKGIPYCPYCGARMDEE